jgi:hypothetical protein
MTDTQDIPVKRAPFEPIRIPTYLELVNTRWFKTTKCTYESLQFQCGTVKANSLFYRGSSSYALTSGSWFSPLLLNSINYIKPSGFLNAFTVKKDINLLILNNATNVNHLYKYFFEKKQFVNYNLVKILTNHPPTTYSVPRRINGILVNQDKYFGDIIDIDGNQTVNNTTLDTKPLRIDKDKEVRRKSYLEFDIMFLKTLCDLGFDGYVQSIARIDDRYVFYPEMALCNPFILKLRKVYIIKDVKDQRQVNFIERDLKETIKKK